MGTGELLTICFVAFCICQGLLKAYYYRRESLRQIKVAEAGFDPKPTHNKLKEKGCDE